MRNLLKVASAAAVACGLAACGQATDDANNLVSVEEMNMAIETTNSSEVEVPVNEVIASDIKPVAETEQPAAAKDKPASRPAPKKASPPATPEPKKPEADPHAGHDMNDM